MKYNVRELREPGGLGGLVVSVLVCELTSHHLDFPGHLDFPPVVHDWVNKDLGVSSRVCATG